VVEAIAAVSNEVQMIDLMRFIVLSPGYNASLGDGRV